jgi:hypothetical protein
VAAVDQEVGELWKHWRRRFKNVHPTSRYLFLHAVLCRWAVMSLILASGYTWKLCSVYFDDFEFLNCTVVDLQRLLL